MVAVLTVPVGIIVLKVPIFHRKCQNSCVMVEPKVIMGTFNPFNLLRRKFRQPGDFSKSLMFLW